MSAGPLRCDSRWTPQLVEPCERTPPLLQLLDETRNRGQRRTEWNSASGRSIEHVALNLAHDTARCYVTPSTIQPIVRVAGTAHVGNFYGGKSDDRLPSIGLAVIVAIDRHQGIPLMIRTDTLLVGHQILKCSPCLISEVPIAEDQ